MDIMRQCFLAYFEPHTLYLFLVVKASCRPSIICLQDKQSGLIQKMNQQVQTPENVPRLFDLVTVRDERLRLAFYSQLGNTVVAKNLDQVCSTICHK